MKNKIKKLFEDLTPEYNEGLNRTYRSFKVVDVNLCFKLDYVETLRAAKDKCLENYRSALKV